MELCIKTVIGISKFLKLNCFNPCFNGTMYKNIIRVIEIKREVFVSILVLMELCIKTSSFQDSDCVGEFQFQSLF